MTEEKQSEQTGSLHTEDLSELDKLNYRLTNEYWTLKYHVETLWYFTILNLTLGVITLLKAFGAL